MGNLVMDRSPRKRVGRKTADLTLKEKRVKKKEKKDRRRRETE